MFVTRYAVRRETPGTLDAQEWTFTLIDNQIVLDRYMELSRPTKRHKEQGTRWYERLDHRSNTLTLAEVPLPDDVAAEALQKVVSQFRVVRELKR